MVQSFLSTQRDGRACLLKRKEKLKTRRSISPPKGETKQKLQDPSVPKRPPALFLFCSEYIAPKPEDPGLSIGDVVKELEAMWSNTAADAKQPYEQRLLS